MRRRTTGAGWIVLAVMFAAALPAQEAAPPAGSFTFSEGRGQTVELTIADADGVSAVTWPDSVDGRWDTALLGVQVAAAADVPAPYVEIAAGSTVDRQYFAPGDSGLRWLNLSPARGIAAGTRITLRADGITFSAPSARLRVFGNAPDLSESILVLAPHPEDAEIAAFGLYANRRASVVTVTAGNAGAPTYEAVFDDPGELYLFKGRIRLIDSITVPLQGGIPPERTFNMGSFDARLAEMYEKRDAVIPEMYRPNADINVYRRENVASLLPKRPRDSKWSHLVDDMLALLRKVKPEVVVAPHPQLDTHRDHQFTTVALAEALERWNRDVTLLLYTNHADRNRYPYGPAGTLMSLPPPPAADVLVDRVYSHPVPPPLQRLKLFALESMHDLRYTPTRQYQFARPDARTIVPEKVGPEPDITYLRRGPRSNELFYVYDRDGFGAMVKAFLAGRRSLTN